MLVFQLTSPNLETADILRAVMLDQINTWSRLDRLAEAGNVTQPFSDAIWKKHPTEMLHYVDWMAVYNNLGDDGRKIADVMVGSVESPGPLLRTDLAGGSRLQLVEVADPIAEGYLRRLESDRP